LILFTLLLFFCFFFVLVLPADFVDTAGAQLIVGNFLKTPFQAGRYAERLCMLDGEFQKR